MTTFTDYAKLADEIEGLAKEKETIGAVPPTAANHERKLKIGEKLYRSLPAIISALRELEAARVREREMREAIKSALKRLEKGAPGWGVAKDELRAALWRK